MTRADRTEREGWRDLGQTILETALSMAVVIYAAFHRDALGMLMGWAFLVLSIARPKKRSSTKT